MSLVLFLPLATSDCSQSPRFRWFLWFQIDIFLHNNRHALLQSFAAVPFQNGESMQERRLSDETHDCAVPAQMNGLDESYQWDNNQRPLHHTRWFPDSGSIAPWPLRHCGCRLVALLASLIMCITNRFLDPWNSMHSIWDILLIIMHPFVFHSMMRVFLIKESVQETTTTKPRQCPFREISRFQS